MCRKAPKKSTAEAVDKLIASATKAATPKASIIKFDGRLPLTFTDELGYGFGAVGVSYSDALEVAAMTIRNALARGIAPHLQIRITE